MSRLLNQEHAMRGRKEPDAAPGEPVNRLSQDPAPAASTPAPAMPPSVVRHPIKRRILFGLLLGGGLGLFLWTHRPPDPWVKLLDGMAPAPMLTPAKLKAPVRAEPPPIPLRFAEERTPAALAALPPELAITVQTGQRPRKPALPEDPATAQAIDALTQLEDALSVAADVTRKTSAL